MRNNIVYMLSRVVKNIFLFLSLLVLHSIPTSAAEEVQMNLHLKGTLVATGACAFDQKGPIGIDFGIVRYSTLGGNNLKDTPPQLLASAMNCSGDYAGETQLQLKPNNTGVVDYQGEKLMQVMDDTTGTLSKDLGIRLLVNDVSQDMDKAFDVDMKAQPELKAELVQIGNGDSFISGSTFSGSATLTMAFL